MRNLIEYPVTRQEILLFLGAEKQERAPEMTGLVGDMSPLLIDHLIEIVKAAFAMCDGFQRRMNEKGMGFVVPFPEATALIKACNLAGPASQTGRTSNDLASLRQAIIDHTHGDLFWIGEILLGELEKETGFTAAVSQTSRIDTRMVLKRLHLAVKALGKIGSNNVTLFEDIPLKSQEAYDAWKELNDAQADAAKALEFKLLFDNEWLRAKIATDPELDCEAGTASQTTQSGGE